jgi:hypothetical protein
VRDDHGRSELARRLAEVTTGRAASGWAGLADFPFRPLGPQGGAGCCTARMEPWAGPGLVLFSRFSISRIHYSFKYSWNSSKLPKFKENNINPRKIQNKFSLNPYELIYQENLTTSPLSQ